MSMPFYDDQALLKSIREEDPVPVYLIYGRETYYSSVCLQRLLSKLVKKGTESFNFRKFDGAGLDMVAVRTECESLPLMADYKCVLIQNPNLEKFPAADLEILSEIMGDPNPTTVLILYVSSYDLNPKKNARLKKLMDQIARVGIVADIQPKSQAELIKLIRQKCQKAGCSIDQVTCSILIDRCGTAMETLMRETDKLIALKSVKDVNTFDAQIDTHTNGSTNVTNLNLEVPVSLTDDNDLGLDYSNVVTNFATNNGGVAYYVESSNGNGLTVKPLAAINPSNASNVTGTKLADAATSDTDNDNRVNDSNSGETDNGYWQILVLPEKTARALKNSDSNYITQADAATGTLYNVNITVKPGDNKSQLLTFKVGNTTLKVEGNKITGELPFSATTELNSSKQFDDYAAATFVEFTTSPYAQLFDNYNNGNSTKGVKYFSNGDIEGDGLVDDIDNRDNADIEDGYIGLNNYKLAFVRNADHTVTVYRVDDVKEESARLDSKGNGYMIVRAENRLDSKTPSSSRYDFELTWAAPCEEADIETFTLGGYTGVINNDVDEGRTIKVTVPYGTDVTGLIATFDKSIGATIRVNDRVGGVELVSGVTSVNYTNPVKLYVTSESKNNTVEYTVTVNQGLHFSDIDPDDWFYNNVMDAANNGYVTGYPDGTFQPKKATTRAEFASMIANAMGYESEPSDSDTMFPDVANDFWAKAAINFCAQNGIIEGYDDGTFKPNQTITRQEAAAILNNAFDLAEKYGISDEQFPDDGKIANWASDHVYAAKASGLMNGDKDTGNFRPTDTIIRAEAASILMNAKYAGLIK